MKPIYLEMNYFGPHENSVVDFRLLDESPVFLISGDTGAGKSTIFDAMTYALFGTTTGDRDAKEMRSQFATADDRTSVTFYFEQGNLLYRIERSPEQKLSKKRGSGSTLQKSTAKLAIVDRVKGIEKNNIAINPKNVGEEITRLLHLNAEQFKKIILLPQNDFSRFLKSSTPDKEAILKRIFGTYIFTSFSNEIKAKNSEMNAVYLEHDRKQQNLYESSIWNPIELKELEDAAEQEKLDLVTSLWKDRVARKNEIEGQTFEQEEKVTSIEIAYKSALELENQFKNLNNLENDYQQNIIEKSAIFEENSEYLKKLKWASPLKESIHELEQDIKQSKSLKNNIAGIISEKAKDEILLKKLTNEKEDLNKQQENINENKKAAEKIFIQIQLSLQVEKKQSKVEELKLEQADNLTLLESFKANLGQAAENISTLQDDVISDDYFINKREERNQLELTFRGKLIPTFQKVKHSKDDIVGLELKLKENTITLSENKDNLEKAKFAYNEKLKGRRRLMIAQLQSELQEGEACPVCGALEHPFTETIEESSYKELENLLKEIDESQKKQTVLLEKNKQLQQLKTELKTSLDLKKIEADEFEKELSILYSEFIADYSQIFPDSFDEVSIEESLLNLTKSLELEEVKNDETKLKLADLESKKLELQEKVKGFEYSNQEFNRQIENLNAEITEIGITETSYNLIRKRNRLMEKADLFEKHLSELMAQLSDIKIKISSQTASLNSFESQEATLLERISANKEKIKEKFSEQEAFTTEFQILKEWAYDDDLIQISQKVEQYKADKARLKVEIKNIQQLIQNKNRPNLALIEEEKKQTNENYVFLQKKLVSAENEVEQAKLILSELKKVIKEQDKDASKKAAITKLYNAISGRASEDKLRLETYVVQNYLEKILDYANLHFINQLSNNRYRFELAGEGNNRRMDHGLDINIYDNETGATRSADTLSGGETFIAALSIALALSEVVQNTANGVQIEALFIDEGFGSLDQETLQKAMQALEQIGENRLVGVISHVEEMKATIGQQIIINKMGDGRSNIKSVIK